MQLHDIPDDVLPLVLKHLGDRDSLAVAPQVANTWKSFQISGRQCEIKRTSEHDCDEFKHS